MAKRAVILVPSQGLHARQFFWSAKAIQQQAYRSRALIVRTQVMLPKEYNGNRDAYKAFPVGLFTEKGRPFAFAERWEFSAMLTVSHAGSMDGPNLSYNAGGYQPWSSYDPEGERDGNPYAGGTFRIDMLRPRAREFWSSVGRSLTSDGNIILLGCNLGMGYHEHVANASGRTTYGPASQCAAADAATVVRLVRGIERGNPAAMMKRAEPVRR